MFTLKKDWKKKEFSKIHTQKFERSSSTTSNAYLLSVNVLTSFTSRLLMIIHGLTVSLVFYSIRNRITYFMLCNVYLQNNDI